jgi:hypothetical protein
MSFNETAITNGVSISGSTDPFNTYIKTENAGIYNLQFSAQVDKTDSGTDEIDIWLRKNGIDLIDTATKITLTNNNTKVVAAWNWFVQSATNDYYQLIWSSADTGMRLFAEASSSAHPGIPSVITTVNRVDQFLSNTGSFSGSFNGNFTGSLLGTASFATSASYALDATTASYALTASSADNFTVRGTITAQQLNVQTITSSIIYSSGSNIFGNDLTNTQVLTGSVSITGSLAVNGSSVIVSSQTSSMSVASASLAQNAISSSYSLVATSASYAVSATSASYITGSNVVGTVASATSASYALTASYASNVPATSSFAISASQAETASYALTASYSLSGTGFPYSGSAVITGSLLVSGSGITGSLEGTASYALTASYAANVPATSSFAISASQALSSSYAISASFATYANNSPGFTVQFSQSSAATTWSFTHNLNTRNPIVQVYDTDYKQIIPNDIVGTGVNTAEVRFDYAQAGYVVMSNGGGLYVTGSTSELVQTVGATTWSFTHNLNSKYVNFEVYDSNDYVIIPAGIRVLTTNTAELYFAYAQTGRAVAQFSGINGAPNATTASYAVTATSASYALNTTTASYAVNATSASFATTAVTASYLNPIVSSYVVLTQVSQSLNFADDAAAAAGGVPLGGLYRNGNFILIRIS